VTGTLPVKDEEDPLGVFGDFGKPEDRPDAKERTALPLLALEQARLSTNNYQRGRIVTCMSRLISSILNYSIGSFKLKDSCLRMVFSTDIYKYLATVS